MINTIYYNSNIYIIYMCVCSYTYYKITNSNTIFCGRSRVLY